MAVKEKPEEPLSFLVRPALPLMLPYLPSRSSPGYPWIWVFKQMQMLIQRLSCRAGGICRSVGLELGCVLRRGIGPTLCAPCRPTSC